MRIGIDARELTGAPTGVGRYLAHLLREWGQGGAGAHHAFMLYAPEPLPPASAALAAGLGAAVTTIPGAPGTWWEQVRLAVRLRRQPPDVFFAPAYTAPVLAPCPTVVTVHDLSFMAHPEWFRPRERWRRSVVTRMAVRRARLVLTVSEFSRAEVVRLTGTPADRVLAIPHGLPLEARASDPGPRDPLVLYAGSIFNRRHVPDLLRAFASVVGPARPDAAIAIVGHNRTWPHEDLAALIRELGMTGRARLWSYVSDETLADLYRRASVFVFLSEYEGFGFTPLEAIACGVPAVVTDTPVAREVYGGGVVYVPRGDIAAAGRAILSLLAEGPARRACLAAADAVLGRYSWGDAAAGTLTALESAGR